jgi:hypothetical protein
MDQEETKRALLHNVEREKLLWAIGGATVIVALIQLSGRQAIGWLLLLAGLVLLGVALQKCWRQLAQSQILRGWLTQLDLTTGLVLFGGVLVITGLVVRFSPQDIGIGLSIAGLVFLAGGSITLFSKASGANTSIDIPSSRKPLPSETDAEAADGYTRLAEEFRWHVSDAVFRHAQRASRMTFVVGLIFFAVGIGVFVLLAYGVYQFQNSRPDQDTSTFGRLSAYLSSQLELGRNENIVSILTRTFPHSIAFSGNALSPSRWS